MSKADELSTRGKTWFASLSGKDSSDDVSEPKSVLICDSKLGPELTRFLCIVPNPTARFPMVREGEVGLDEAFALARSIRALVEQDKAEKIKRPIIAIVDVKSQAYGRREETAGIYHAAATSADAFATARMAGHPIVSLVVGQALSGGFLTHGYQANRIIAFDDPGVVIHAMHKEAAARVTKRNVSELDELAKTVIPLSYKIGDFAKLGILHELLKVTNVEKPSAADIEMVTKSLLGAIVDARSGARDLSIRWSSPAAKSNRAATLAVRKAMSEQWN